ncbi:AAA family ATPase [Streptomyces sp. NPDC003952]
MDPIRLAALDHLPAVLQGLGRNPALPEELAVRLLPYGMAPLRIALREGFTPSPALCAEFLARGEAEALAHAASLPPEFAARLAADPDPAVRAVRARREGAAAGRQAVFAADAGADVREALAERPDLAAELLAALAADRDARVRAAVAARPAQLPEDLLRGLLTDTDPKVRAAACKHGPPHDLHSALLGDPATRKRVVRFLELDPGTAGQLAADPDEEVRAAVASHPALPAELRDLLARDVSAEVRGKVFVRADTPPELRDEIHAWLTAGAGRAEEDWTAADEEDVFCEITLTFLELESYPWVADDPAPHVHSPYVGLRRTAAGSGRLPAPQLREMLGDEDPTVRFAALRAMPGLDLATAEDIDRRHRPLKGSAHRPADHVRFPPGTLRRFAADPDARMRVLALREPELPAELLDRLAADEDHAVRRAAAADPRLSPGTLLRLLADGTESVAGAAAASPALPVDVMRAVLGLAAERRPAERGIVVLMCGLPGSGKTTYALGLERRGYTRLSVDEEVWERIGRDPAELDPEEYDRLRADAERELWCELEQLLEDREPVVVDNSFWSRAARDRYKALIERHGCRWELVHFKASPDTLRSRLAARNSGARSANRVTVSDALLERYAAGFEEPVGEGERVFLQG